MIQRVDLYHTDFYKKSDFTGSLKGMRYTIARKQPEEQDPYFLVTIFPGPYNEEHTADELKVKKEYPFSNEAIDEICTYLNEYYQEHAEEFEKGRIIY